MVPGVAFEKLTDLGIGVSGAPKPEPLYVCVYIPEFPAQALLRLRPELARSPVVVLAGDPPLQTVCSLNLAASRMGIEHGMTRSELDTFPHLVLLHRSAAQEQNTRVAVLEAAGMFTPRMECQQVASPAFAVVLDMTGTSRIFGPAEQSMQAIRRKLMTLRLHVRMGASANLRTSVCIAPSARKGPIVVPQGHEGRFLRNLPLSALDATVEQAERLTLWGLVTLGDLAGLPEAELVTRFGPQGRRLWLLARGDHQHLMVPEEPVFALDEYLAFDAPVELLDPLLFVLRPMLEQLLARAQQRALALASVTVRLGLDGGGEHERTVKPALPLAESGILLKLIHLDLQAHPPAAGVLSLAVHAVPGERSKVQIGMFSPQLPEPMRLDVTLARIAALVGEDRVGRGKLLDTNKPDSFAMERFVVPEALGRSSSRDVADSTAPVALRRLRPPVSVTVWRDGARLLALQWQSKRYKVEKAYGPWRRSGDWWTAAVWSREEWDVQVKASAGEILLGVITHDLLTHQWQMEGLYD